jgi:hypothetical protein
MTKDGRKPRKTSARPTKTGKRRPHQSERWKQYWADPERRAKMIEHNRRIARDPNKRTRFGIPDGMRKEEADAARAAAHERAHKKVAKMKEKGIIPPDIDERAEKALTVAVEILEEPGDKRTRLAAGRLLLDFLKAKPASKSEITVNKAEEWLAAVADDDDEQETASDEEEAS